MFHQDRSRLNRENVVLTKEINDLRRKAKALSLQQNGVERVRHLCLPSALLHRSIDDHMRIFLVQK